MQQGGPREAGADTDCEGLRQVDACLAGVYLPKASCSDWAGSTTLQS